MFGFKNNKKGNKKKKPKIDKISVTKILKMMVKFKNNKKYNKLKINNNRKRFYKLKRQFLYI
jgi:hypothetical protein